MTNDKGSHSGTRPNGKQLPCRRSYDLADRTARFAEGVILFAREIPKTAVTFPLIGQVVRSGTSIGANYCEADDAVSRKDFRNRICICRKEARETKYWIRMIAVAVAELRDEARPLWQEAKELHLIFSKAFHSAGRPRTGQD